MFGTLSSLVPADAAYPPRTHTLEVRRKILDGSIYDVLDQEFHDERNGAGEYVPLRKRRPSVRYNLCRLVVQDSVALLFGEGRFPAIRHADQSAAAGLEALIRESKLGQVMLEAAIKGSVGSVVVHMRVLKGRVFFEAMDTGFLTPEYDPEAPDTLLRVTERYKVRGDALAAAGYAIEQDRLLSWHWFQRIWDSEAETWFEPWPVSDSEHEPKRDKKRSTIHKLGFVPMVWIKNLPGASGIDGACTFAPAIDTAIEIDYQLSQGGRGLKYSSDPLLMIKEPAAPEGEFIRSGNNAMQVSKDGDAKLLEISGTAAAAVIEYAKFLRELALESIHGNRSSADKISAAQSGRALEMMHQPLIWVADQLRISYGDNGILPLLRMVARVSKSQAIKAEGKTVPPISPASVDLQWQPWFDPTPHDDAALATFLTGMFGAGLISRETAVRLAGNVTELPDGVDEEVARIKADLAEERNAAAELPAPQSKVTESVPA